jgi:hypothetical protein
MKSVKRAFLYQSVDFCILWTLEKLYVYRFYVAEGSVVGRKIGYTGFISFKKTDLLEVRSSLCIQIFKSMLSISVHENKVMEIASRYIKIVTVIYHLDPAL